MPEPMDYEQLREHYGDKAVEQLAETGAMVPDLTHKIGTPLNIILTTAELLESSVGDARGAELLASIHQQIERITTIIQSFLDIARPDPPCFSSNSIQQVIEDSLVFVSDRLEQQAVRVSTTYTATPTLSCDRNRLIDLFTKLFKNAADAMKEGGELNITLELKNEEILIQVEDNGEGIDASNLPKIFEPFFTTKPSGYSPSGYRCGLGLVAAKKIAEEHGGTIQVESEPGKGTTCFLHLAMDLPGGGS